MRLRSKITVAFFLVSTLVSAVLAVTLHRFVERQLEVELRDKLRDIGHLGARAIDTAAYRRLVGRLGELDDDAVAAIERSPDWMAIYDQLRQIRAAEPALIHYAYLLTPTGDPSQPRFVVDADVLELEARVARGEQVEDISRFGKPYDVTDIPLLARALADCTSQLEPDLVLDKAFGVRSISAYTPLVDARGEPLRDAAGRCLGVLGVDLTDRKMQAALASAGHLALEISIAVVALALVVSIVMGTLLTRSVLALSATVRRFAAKDFSARTRVRSQDEIGQLGDSFNAMADIIQVHSDRLEDLVRQRTAELTEEKQTSERLLLNVLPGPIAERLKTGENLIVDRFDAVSVLFADIVGFTALSSRTSPEALVTMLNELFSTFDRLAEQHGLEKIKTIGDAYMVVTAAAWYRGAMPRPPRAAPLIGALAVGLLLGGCSSTPGAGATYACKTPPPDLAACATDADCATVEVGCYCGPQPVHGVAVKYAQAAQSCEDAAASACALGCLNELALQTQDGKKAALGTPVAVRCDRSSGSGTCTSYLP